MFTEEKRSKSPFKRRARSAEREELQLPPGNTCCVASHTCWLPACCIYSPSVPCLTLLPATDLTIFTFYMSIFMYVYWFVGVAQWLHSPVSFLFFELVHLDENRIKHAPGHLVLYTCTHACVHVRVPSQTHTHTHTHTPMAYTCIGVRAFSCNLYFLALFLAGLEEHAQNPLTPGAPVLVVASYSVRAVAVVFCFVQQLVYSLKLSLVKFSFACVI